MTTTAIVQTLIDLPLDLLDTAENVRRTVNEASIRELADSIKATGLAQPILVRPYGVPNGHKLAKQHYQVVAGQRRVAAVTLLGEKTIPAIVRDLSDGEAREIQITENLQREDLPALEEGDAYAELLTTLGSIAAIAARVGKELSYVTKRLKLCNLCLFARESLKAKLITVDHALLLARLGFAEQEDALKWALDRNAGSKTHVQDVVGRRIKILETEREERNSFRDWEAESPLRLKEHIEDKSGTPLNRAPWDLDDAELSTGAGACSSCPQNTSANVPLFGDLELGESTCTNRTCFETKREAFVRIKLRTGDDEVAVPLRLSWKATQTVPRQAKDGSGPSTTAVLKYGQWLDAKRGSCPNVRAGVTVDWSDANDRGYMGNSRKLRKPGEVIQVCIAAKCKVHPKAYEKAAKQSGGLRNENSDAARAEREDIETQWIPKEAKVRRALYDAIQAVILPEQVKRLVIRMHGDSEEICQAAGAKWKGWQGGDKQVEEILQKSNDLDLNRFLFMLVAANFLQPDTWDASQKDKGRKELREYAKIVGIDAAAVEKRIEQEQVAAAKEEAPAKNRVKTPAKSTKKKAAR